MSSTINFGITQYADEILEIPEDLSSLLSFKEYRVNSFEDVKNIPANEWCIAHGPDAYEDTSDECINALAKHPSVAYVNIHPRPEDEYTLCRKCYCRMINLQTPKQSCDRCGANVSSDQYGEELTQYHFDTIITNIIGYAEVLRVSGKKLLLENTFEPPSLMKKIFSALPSDIGFTLDVGHCLFSSVLPQDYIYEMRDQLTHLHLHDNMGGYSEMYHDRHSSPGTGIANWDLIAKALNQIEFKGTATFECMPEFSWVQKWKSNLT